MSTPVVPAEDEMDLTVAVAAGPEVVRRGLEAMLGVLDGVSWRSYRTAEEVVVGAISTGWAQVSLVEADALRRLRPDARDVLARTRVVAMVPSVEPNVLSLAVQCSADGHVVLADSPSRSHVVSTVLRSEAGWDQPTPSLS